MKFGPHPGFDPCTSGCLNQPKHRLGVLQRSLATTPSPLWQNLDARVGIDPENSISDRKIAEFACQSTTIPHYSGTILLLCIHLTMLAISLAIGMMDLA